MSLSGASFSAVPEGRWASSGAVSARPKPGGAAPEADAASPGVPLAPLCPAPAPANAPGGQLGNGAWVSVGPFIS